MTRKYDLGIMGKDFKLELTPELLAYEMSMAFSNQIIKRCDELNVTLSQLAKMLGISPSTLSEKLNGQNMTLKSIASMALALDCDVDAPELVPLESSEVENVCSPMSVTDDIGFTSMPNNCKSILQFKSTKVKQASHLTAKPQSMMRMEYKSYDKRQVA